MYFVFTVTTLVNFSMDSINADSPGNALGPVPKKQLLNVVDYLCRLILHEVVNVRGKYFYHDQELAMDDKYIGLREWDNQEYRAA